MTRHHDHGHEHDYDEEDLTPEAEPVGRRVMLKTTLLGLGGLGLVGATGTVLLNGNPPSQSSALIAANGPVPQTSAATVGARSARLKKPPAPATTRATASAKASATPTTRDLPSVAPTSMGFTHPGLLHTQADFDRMTAKVKARKKPWKAAWAKLTANAHAQSTWKPNPQKVVWRGDGTANNYPALYNDIHAAYQNGLRWKIAATTANGDAARDILNAWSATLTTISGGVERFIVAGTQGYQMANAGELMRGYPGFKLERFKKMMLDVFYPMNDAFLKHHNGAYITNYWASWDQLTMASIIAIGILCDDKAKVKQALTYYTSGPGMGAIKKSVPVLYPGGLGQWVEAGRDQGHATLGIGMTAAFCEMAWNQGHDMYGFDGNRFMKGAEYVAKYNLGQDVPYTSFVWHEGAPGVWEGWQTFTAAGPDSRGATRPIWESIYNHYAERRGLSVPHIAAIAAKGRPEGGGGDYGPNSGGFDQLGCGTLTFSR